MNFLKLNKSMLLLVAATVVAQSAAMDSEGANPGRVSAAWNFAKDTTKSVASSSYNFLVDTAVNHPYATGLAVVAVPAVGYGVFKGYKKYTTPVDQEKQKRRAKVAQLKKDTARIVKIHNRQTSTWKSKAQTAAKYTGLGTGVIAGTAGLSYAAYKAYNDGYYEPAYKAICKAGDFLAPYLTKKSAAITAGVLGATGTVLGGYKIAQKINANKMARKQAISDLVIVKSHAQSICDAIASGKTTEGSYIFNDLIADSYSQSLDALKALYKSDKDVHNRCTELSTAVAIYNAALGQEKNTAAANLRDVLNSFVAYFLPEESVVQ